MNLGSISKAIAGGLVGAGVAEAARYGFQVDAPTATALSVILTGVIGYVVGHLLVFLAPKNTPKVTPTPPVPAPPVTPGV